MFNLAVLGLFAAPYVFNANERWTLGIAAYAALVATFLLGWDAYKWLASGPKISLTAATGMMMFDSGVEDPNTYVVLTAWNVGDQPTTITNMAAMYFDSWWRAYIFRRKPSQSFVINMPSTARPIPYRFEIGDQWIGMANQTEEVTQLATRAYLFLIIYTARGGLGHRVRVTLSAKKAADEKLS